jgi:hypothetical protein
MTKLREIASVIEIFDGNVTFGGAARDQLYIAALASIYRVRLATRGIQRP